MTKTALHETILTGAAMERRIDELAAFSDDPECLTRLTLRLAHRKAAGRVSAWMREAGLETRIDALGTVVGRRAGAAPDAPVLLLGSHIDTVRDAGRYDGNYGVIAAIAVLDELNRTGARLPFAIEALAFGDEEGVRFSSTLTGSRAVAGTFDPAALDDTDATGMTRGEALLGFGADPEPARSEARDPKKTIGYVELHIEQGPVLESLGLPIGLVTAINGGTRAEIVVQGQSGHAGTLPMPMRRDALAAAAEMMLAIEEAALGHRDLVATVGRIEVPRGAANTVPGAARMSLDLRSSDDALRNSAVDAVREAIRRIAQKRGVTASLDITYQMPATLCDKALMAGLETSFTRLGFKPFHLSSGAGHDAMSFRGAIPCAMIFTRCRRGVSHHPDEYASPDDMEAAARVLMDFILSLGEKL